MLQKDKEDGPGRPPCPSATLTLILSPVTQAEGMVEVEARESNDGTASVTGNSKSVIQTVFLEQTFGKGDLNRKEGRQKACC